MRRLVVVLVAVLIVGLTWWKVSNRHVVEPQPVESDLSQAQAPPADLDSRMYSPQSGSGSDLASQERAASSHAIHAASATQAVQLVDAGHNKLLSQYQNEKVDAQWARTREQSLVSHSVSPQIQDLKVEPKNMTVHCRSTTCAITADFATRGAADDWLTLYATNPGTNLYNLSSQVTPNADGSAHIQIYGLAKH